MAALGAPFTPIVPPGRFSLPIAMPHPVMVSRGLNRAVTSIRMAGATWSSTRYLELEIVTIWPMRAVAVTWIGTFALPLLLILQEAGLGRPPTRSSRKAGLLEHLTAIW